MEVIIKDIKDIDKNKLLEKIGVGSEFIVKDILTNCETGNLILNIQMIDLINEIPVNIEVNKSEE